MKYYAVKKGRKPGIYATWAECQEQTKGFSGAVFKSFPTKEEAEAYCSVELGEEVNSNFTNEQLDAMISCTDTIHAFTDGSYNKELNRYGYGLVAIGLGEIHEEGLFDCDPMTLPLESAAGEILAATQAMEYCLEKNVKNLEIYYDNMGIEQWLTGGWDTNKYATQQYKAFYDSIKDKLNVKFHKVPAHCGIKYNERADYLAKHAVDLA